MICPICGKDGITEGYSVCTACGAFKMVRLRFIGKAGLVLSAIWALVWVVGTLGSATPGHPDNAAQFAGIMMGIVPLIVVVVLVLMFGSKKIWVPHGTR